uniref:Uncharacterized protein n=1 Tax=Plectus sambesii TaxID=2011161 RepID=A0A914UQA0_9BILA
MSAAYEQAVEYAMREAHLPRRSSLKKTRARTEARNNRNVDFSPDVTTSSDSDPQRSSPDDLSEASYQQYNDAVNETISRYAHHIRNGKAEVVGEKQTAKEFPKETATGRKFQPRNVHITHEIRVTTSDYSTEPSNRSSMDFDQSIVAYQEQLQEQQKKLYAQQQQQQKEQQQQLYQQQLQQKLQQQLQIQQEQQRQQQLEEQDRLRQQEEQEQKLRQMQQQREKQHQEQLLLQEHKRRAHQQDMERQQHLQMRQQQEQQRRHELSQPSTISVDQLASRNQSQTFATVHQPSHSRQTSMKKMTPQNAPPRSAVYAIAMPVEQPLDVGKRNNNNTTYQVHPQQLYAAPARNDINVNTVSAASGFKLPQYYLANPQSKQQTSFQIGKGTAKKNGESGSMTCCWILMGGIGLTIALIVIFIAGSQLHIWDGII